MLIKAIEDGSIAVHSNHDIPAKDIVLIFQISFILTGVVLLIVGAMCVANAIIASKTRNEPTRGRYIACIVTGALSTDFSIVGGILGLIYLKRQERQKQIEE